MRTVFLTVTFSAGVRGTALSLASPVAVLLGAATVLTVLVRSAAALRSDRGQVGGP